jgi:hypothetical protein
MGSNALVSHDMRFDAVYVVESLRPTDRKTGSELYDSVIGPSGYSHPKLLTELFRPGTRLEFIGVLKTIARRARREARWPLLHLETHGGETGLELASGEAISWPELKPYLEDISVASRLNFSVTVAACSGGYLASTISPADRAPVWAVIGPAQPVGDDQLLAAFGAYYREFLRSLDGTEALAVLRRIEADQRKKYIFMPAVTMFTGAYARYVREDCTPEALRKREIEVLKMGRRGGLPASVTNDEALM